MLLLGFSFKLLALFVIFSTSKPLPDTSPSLNAVDKTTFRQECQKAIDKLPDDLPGKHLPASFSKGSPEEPYSLPKWSKSKKICGVFIRLKDEKRTETSSWTEIKSRLAEMNQACFEWGTRSLQSFVGSGNNIQLDLVGYNRPVLGNQTSEPVSIGAGSSTYKRNKE